jgi:hypothetical protein
MVIYTLQCNGSFEHKIWLSLKMMQCGSIRHDTCILLYMCILLLQDITVFRGWCREVWYYVSATAIFCGWGFFGTSIPLLALWSFVACSRVNFAFYLPLQLYSNLKTHTE